MWRSKPERGGPGRSLLALAWLLGAGLPQLAVARPAPVSPEAQVFPLGRLQLVSLRDADNVVANDGRTFGLGVDPKAVAGVLSAAGAPPDPITLSVDALLVKAPGRLMLFDTGLGPPAHGVLLQSLAKAGVAPDQVADVFITHAHPDHVGGLVTADGRSAFPRAVIHLSAREWATMEANPRLSAVVAAVSAQVRPFEPGAELAPGVRAVALYGHTPGHVGYEISSDGQSLFDMGDTAHSSIVSLARPDWGIEYDGDAAQARASREATLARLAAAHALVFAPHFPFPGVGRIERAGQGYIWEPAATAVR